MNQSQQNKLNMYISVQKSLNNYTALWTDKIAVKEAVTELNELITLIREKGALLAVSTTGVTLTKAEKKRRMVEKAVEVSGVAFAYATKEKNQKLQAIFNYTLSELTSAADNTAIDHCTAIHNEILKLLPSLANYDVTAANISDLLVAIEAFKEAISEKGSTKGDGVANTKTLATLFKEANILLKNRSDKLLFRFKETDLAFFNAYTNARVVLGSGGSKTKKEKKPDTPAK